MIDLNWVETILWTDLLSWLESQWKDRQAPNLVVYPLSAFIPTVGVAFIIDKMVDFDNNKKLIIVMKVLPICFPLRLCVV